MRAGLALALILPVAFAGCEPDRSDEAIFLGWSAQAAAEANGVAYRAERRYTDYVGVVPGEYTERYVQADEEHFRVDLLTLNGVARDAMTDAGEIKQFDLLQALFQGGRGRYNARGRDFRLKDLELFEANYTYVIYDDPALVAGRLADVVDVTPRFGDRPSYTVWIDRETLITLKYLEFQPNGALAAEMEVLSIDYGPDLAEVQFQQSAVGAATEVPQDQSAAFVSFAVLQPTYLPRGFVWRSTRVRQLSGIDTLTSTYSDGLQELGIVQYREQEIRSANNTLPAKVGLKVYGPTTDAGFAVIGTEVHVTCKLDPQEIMTFIESLDLLLP